MESKYFITAFLEVESIDPSNGVALDLYRIGNLFDTEDEARKVLHLIKKTLGDYEKTLHDIRK